MHLLLERQLRKLGVFSAPAGFDEFMAAIDAAYLKFDRDRQLLDGSLELVSEELLERNRQLRKEIQRRKELEVELTRLRSSALRPNGNVGHPIPSLSEECAGLPMSCSESECVESGERLLGAEMPLGDRAALGRLHTISASSASSSSSTLTGLVK
jgi:hypothetical protein